MYFFSLIVPHPSINETIQDRLLEGVFIYCIYYLFSSNTHEWYIHHYKGMILVYYIIFSLLLLLFDKTTIIQEKINIVF
jgi:hypothetical protein